ncbi:MAG: PilZ domain-containing protein [Proteobacteria bacterium]|nr:PilZ domain-containing protein [Pseudomonadota bacterium]
MAETIANDDRRSVYRVKPISSEELNFSVLGERHQMIRGEVTDVAITGARVRFDINNAPKLASGDHVVMAFASPLHQYDTNVLAKVISTSEDLKEKVVQVSFDEDYEPLKIDRDELFALFNRRAIQRGAADSAKEDFVAKVSPGSGGEVQLNQYEASILNISTTGVSFTINEEVHKVLEDHSDIRIELKRPDNGSTSTIACSVRHRSKFGDGFIYGCEYDWSATTDPLAVVEDLVSYLFGLTEQN